MSTNTLKINLNEEYKIKIEDADKLDKSYFKEIYEKAGKATADILKKSEEADKIKDNPFKRQGEEYNNIIAFCGERGTGKSSAMISFVQSLLMNDKSEEFYKDYTPLNNYKYHSLNVIDPSMFEEKENIFEVILAQLFSSFKKKLDDKQHNTDQEKKRKVLEAFQEVYDNLKTVQKNGEKYNGEALETLSNLSSGANLRGSFKKLVNLYLDYIKQNDNTTCLIIPIDDFDLNVKAVADMAEQIRKYLMIPNVVILMAADMKQLSDAKEQSVRDDFKTLLEAEAMSESPKMITAKYILKLIPIERRLVLPSLKLNGKTTYIELNEPSTIKAKKDEPVEKLILRAIQEKTGLIFLAPKYQLTYFVPRSLRELREFLMFLNGMCDENKDENLLAFKDYFVKNWCSNEIGKDYLDLINEWLDRTYFERNKYFIVNTLDTLRDLYVSKYKTNEPIEDVLDWHGIFSDSIEDIYRKENYAINISLGDVLFVIQKLELINDSELTKYCFAIKTLYSIEMLSLLNKSFYFEQNTKSIKNKSKKDIYIKLEYAGLEELFKIIGGQFIPESTKKLKIIDNNHINYDILPGELFRKEKRYYKSRQSFNINYTDFYFVKKCSFISGGDPDKQPKEESKENIDSYFKKRLEENKTEIAKAQKSGSKTDSLANLDLSNFEASLLYHLFILHKGGGNYLKRRDSDDEAYYSKPLAFGKKREEAKIDFFALFWTSLFPEKIWERNMLSMDYEFKGFFKLLIDNRRKGRILFPIHSIDLINELFVKSNFKHYNWGTQSWEEIVVSIITDLHEKIEKLDINNSWKLDIFLNEDNQKLLMIALCNLNKNRITQTRKEELTESIKNLIKTNNEKKPVQLHSFNVNINTLKREIGYLINNKADEEIIEPILKEIEKCKIKIKDADNSNSSKAMANSKNEKNLTISDEDKQIIMDRFKEKLNSVLDE